MGTSRESFNIFQDIKRKNWTKVKNSLKELFFISKGWNRDLIIKDTFITPFHKKIGCKLFGHKWSTEEDNSKYDFDGNFLCWKCHKWETKEQRRNSKLEKLIK